MRTSDFQFLNPYLKEISYVINREFQLYDDFKMDNSFSVNIKRNENMANVELLLETNLEKENAPFKLKIKVASDFKWENLDEKEVEMMLNVNAPALLLGYMRPIVANITNSSNLPAYNLPFINFMD